MRQQPVIVGLAAAENPCDTACLKSEPSIYCSVLDFLGYYTSDHSRYIGQVTSIQPSAAPDRRTNTILTTVAP
jgi:hypothetical protein